MALIAYH